MRRLQADKLGLLKQLTSVRKAMLTSELAMARARMNKQELEINNLRKPVSSGATVDELATTIRWQRWRTQELMRLNIKHAAMRAEYDETARLVGRAIAEDATADHLKNTLRSENRIKQSRKTEIDAASHFLTHNISDQNI